MSTSAEINPNKPFYIFPRESGSLRNDQTYNYLRLNKNGDIYLNSNYPGHNHSWLNDTYKVYVIFVQRNDEVGDIFQCEGSVWHVANKNFEHLVSGDESSNVLKEIENTFGRVVFKQEPASACTIL